ncbi:glycosyltransferase family 2 protein [Zunongwangia endophytica]|uniref:Glycosyltransferase family 2 protein n=1 Tax=Zunongwangia endophytica TaxID=1808945 RepID=A0ABV8HBC0_9FLAO|nr:glycosyltransferase [Zunongwangia endophytica]MDN3595026.1 glycosyltransferase [Zunongwangia endophytica]
MESKFSLIICTYQRPNALLKLLRSVEEQSLYPSQIIIVDGSTTPDSKSLIAKQNFRNIEYFLVTEKDRGLTKQRNFGIDRVSCDSLITCFLDDDVVLQSNYFQKLMETYQKYPGALGVGGYIIEPNTEWKKTENNKTLFNEFEFDGWKRTLGSRNSLRKKFGLLSDQPPGFMPKFSHGFSTGFLPPSDKIYPVEFFMGCAMSFRTEFFSKLRFSAYFEGYGLYEDMDFCLRLSKLGSLYVNTAAKLHHYHEPSGRPNQFEYGKMVVENGWYVWRIKYNRPTIKAKLMWYKITGLLTLVRLANVFTTSKKQEAFTEFLGRCWAIFAVTFKM